MRVRFPHGVLKSERSEAWYRAWLGAKRPSVRAPIGRQAGLVPTVLTDNRAEVQMGARLLWEQEGFGSTPKRPTYHGSRGLVAQTRLITELR